MTIISFRTVRVGVVWLALLAAPNFALAPASGQGGLSGGVPLEIKQSNHCRALAPRDWLIQGDPQGRGVDLGTLDRAMYAGWSIPPVGLGLNIPGTWGDPETATINLIAGVILPNLGDTGGARYTSSPQPFLGYFMLRLWESTKYTGLVFNKVYPMSQQAYLNSVYTALTLKGLRRTRGYVAAGVALSIRCVVQIAPPASGQGSRQGEGNLCAAYNRQLGVEFAHSPSTGENFMQNPSTDWNQNGPQGPGYYRRVGNTHEKLAAGRSDC